jgi:hypothetical protein
MNIISYQMMKMVKIRILMIIMVMSLKSKMVKITVSRFKAR